MAWKIKFYNKKVENSIKEWPEGILAKLLWIINVIEQRGLDKIGMPHIKALGQGLFEMRAKGSEGIGRALFCLIKEKMIIILNGFIKKTEKTPSKEMNLALKRMEEVKEYE